MFGHAWGQIVNTLKPNTCHHMYDYPYINIMAEMTEKHMGLMLCGSNAARQLVDVAFYVDASMCPSYNPRNLKHMH